MRFGLLMLLALAAGQTPPPAATSAPIQLDKGTVSSSPTASSRRRSSTASQIVIHGEHAPAGFSAEQLPPDQIGRIEILRERTAKSTHERASVGGDHRDPQAGRATPSAWTRCWSARCP